jgi:RimJ/RimL family protein N-acetyltransferase
MIFETERLLVRKLAFTDINAFHKMQSNPNVMQYTDSLPKNRDENQRELGNLISLYNKPHNDFWVYAVTRKKDKKFIGTLAFIKDKEQNTEIGYRYLEKYWNNGYAFEALTGMITHAKTKGIKELVAEVIVKNKASEYLLKKAGFKMVNEYICDDLKLLERSYKLKL